MNPRLCHRPFGTLGKSWEYRKAWNRWAIAISTIDIVVGHPISLNCTVGIVMLRPVKQAITAVLHGCPLVWADQLDWCYRLNGWMATPVSASIEWKKTAAALTLGRLVRFAVKYRIVSFRYQFFALVATGWATKTTTPTIVLFVPLRVRRYFRWHRSAGWRAQYRLLVVGECRRCCLHVP